MNALTPIISDGPADPTRPRRGRSVAGAVAPLALRMHSLVERVASAVPAGVQLPWLVAGATRDRCSPEVPRARVAWAVATVGLLYATQPGRITASASLADALQWFGDCETAARLQGCDLEAAERELAALAQTDGAGALVPYILDTFGPTSRLDVIRDPGRHTHRSARKEIGSFYTPSDVAEFMVQSIAGERAAQFVWFDPACGSGVFLAAALDAAERSGLGGHQLVEFATENLLGTDLSPQATDFTAFVLCQRLLKHTGETPLSAWLSLRRNLVAVDSLTVTQKSGSPGPGQLSLECLFGAITAPIRLVCNPPYTAGAGAAHEAWASLSGAAPSKNLYLPFVEMMWRLASGPWDMAATVTPLAVATNRSADHVRCRGALAEAGGDWTMLFFDRQPHALFGEDAKVRTAILLRRPASSLRLNTSRLLKWTSRQRPQIFREDRVAELSHGGIRRLVPKLGSPTEVQLYAAISAYQMRGPARPRLSSIAPAEIAANAGERDVFVAGTAYNFLNAFRDYPAPSSARGALSASKVHRLTFDHPPAARAGFAILSSRVAFWLWHVECDGFHVPAWFLDELPLLDITFAPAATAELTALGEAIWQGAKSDLLASSNSGKWTFAFRPTLVRSERARVDQLILEAVGAPVAALSALEAFENSTVLVDGRERLAPSSPYDKLIGERLRS